MSFSQNFKKEIQSDRTRTNLLLDLEKEVENLQVEESIKEDIETQLTLLIHDSKKDEKDFRRGTISKEEYRTTISQLNQQLIKLTDTISKLKDLTPPQPKVIPMDNTIEADPDVDILPYSIEWTKIIVWFQKYRISLAEEMTDLLPHLNENRKSKFKEEVLLIVNWLNSYFVDRVLDIEFDVWMRNKLVNSELNSINPEMLIYGIHNLLESSTDQDLNDFMKKHIKEHLEVSALLLLEYFSPN